MAQQDFIRMVVERDNTTQQIEFPEVKTKWNRRRWWVVKILSGLKIEWF